MAGGRIRFLGCALLAVLAIPHATAQGDFMSLVRRAKENTEHTGNVFAVRMSAACTIAQAVVGADTRGCASAFPLVFSLLFLC